VNEPRTVSPVNFTVIQSYSQPGVELRTSSTKIRTLYDLVTIKAVAIII